MLINHKKANFSTAPRGKDCKYNANDKLLDDYIYVGLILISLKGVFSIKDTLQTKQLQDVMDFSIIKHKQVPLPNIVQKIKPLLINLFLSSLLFF